MKSFLLASGNAHKAEEFKELFLDAIKISAAPKSIEIDESGETFTENSLLKAKAYFDTYKVPSMADDSGLVIEALPSILGVQSARFSPDLTEYSQKCTKLIEMLDSSNSKERKAYFVCVLCFYLSPEEIYFFEGRVHGTIGTTLKGNQGFGYDPIFIPDRKENDGKSLAELPEWKNMFSHRAKAVQSALEFFKSSKKA